MTISKSIQVRADKFINEGNDPIEALKKAIQEEQDLICSLLNRCGYLSERGQIAADHLRKALYNKFIK